jgi:hypothetical protein
MENLEKQTQEQEDTNYTAITIDNVYSENEKPQDFIFADPFTRKQFITDIVY